MNYTPISNNHRDIVKHFKTKLDSKTTKLPRIVFFLIINERAYERHILRYLKIIYNTHHYYYIHIDSVSYFIKKILFFFLIFINIS